MTQGNVLELKHVLFRRLRLRTDSAHESALNPEGGERGCEGRTLTRKSITSPALIPFRMSGRKHASVFLKRMSITNQVMMELS